MPETIFSEFAPRVRKSFSRIARIVDTPNLLEIQKQSFDRFLQTGVEMEKRENTGLQSVFTSVFPIRDFNDTASLEFVGYALEQPKYDVQEESSFFADHRTMRPLVDGVISTEEEIDPRLAQGRLEDQSGYVLTIPTEVVVVIFFDKEMALGK